MNDENIKVLLTYLMTELFPAILILAVGWFLIRMLLKAEKKVLKKMSGKVDASQVKFLTSATKVSLWLILFVFVLRQMGVNTAPVITVVAAAGAALALALQGSLSNLASGILMLFTKPFVKGDVITCAGMQGVVESIDLLYTSLVTFDNKIIGLPNSMITTNPVVNATTLENKRIEISVRITYDSDSEKARQTILDLAAGTELFLESPVCTCNVAAYEDTGVKLRFWGWVKKSDYLKALDSMNNGLKQALETAGIKFAYTQVQVVLGKGE